MFAKEWNVLVVDDEPDVLSLSRLVMRDFEVFGQPLKLHMAESKSAALELLHGPLMRVSGQANLPVAFIDVVMETDTAGLDLCAHIRGEMRNKLSTLYVRTGQPGLAPERTVIDRFDISGYFTKAEATEDKLYSLVKSGVRQYYSTAFAALHAELVHQLILVHRSRERMARVMARSMSSLQSDVTGKKIEGVQYKRWVLVDGKVIAGGSGGDEGEALALHRRLAALPGTTLGADGDKLVTDGMDVLIQVGATKTGAEVTTVMTTRFLPPDFAVSTLYRSLCSFSALWRTAT